uniref:Uncharacterized protein n=1 Tax=Timema cristinae TaxID=61476 RepID=A0A7R9GTM9_TIMCR|nr:unnamed protein product [Timema cristinae]
MTFDDDPLNVFPYLDVLGPVLQISVESRPRQLSLPGAWQHLILFTRPVIEMSSSKPSYFWHITDIHYDVHYSTGGNTRKNCWRTENGINVQKPVGKFGDYNCDSPWALVESAAKAMRTKHGDNIEFVLWTGPRSLTTWAKTSTSPDVTCWLLGVHGPKTAMPEY